METKVIVVGIGLWILWKWIFNINIERIGVWKYILFYGKKRRYIKLWIEDPF